MLNNDLLDPKDKEIIRLKLVIERFKKYDEERKKYYSDKMQRLGELEAYIQEKEQQEAVEPDKEIESLNRTIKNQRKELGNLNRLLAVKNLDIEKLKFLDVAAIKNENEALKKMNKYLRNQNKNLKSIISELVYKLNSSYEHR